MYWKWLERFFEKSWWKYPQYTLPISNIESQRNFSHWLSHGPERINKSIHVSETCNLERYSNFDKHENASLAWLHFITKTLFESFSAETTNFLRTQMMSIIVLRRTIECFACYLLDAFSFIQWEKSSVKRKKTLLVKLKNAEANTDFFQQFIRIFLIVAHMWFK
jgi:hypothetical protein